MLANFPMESILFSNRDTSLFQIDIAHRMWKNIKVEPADAADSTCRLPDYRISSTLALIYVFLPPFTSFPIVFFLLRFPDVFSVDILNFLYLAVISAFTLKSVRRHTL